MLLIETCLIVLFVYIVSRIKHHIQVIAIYCSLNIELWWAFIFWRTFRLIDWWIRPGGWLGGRLGTFEKKVILIFKWV